MLTYMASYPCPHLLWISLLFLLISVSFSQVPMMNKRFLRKQRMHELLSESSDHISNTFHISSRDVIETRVPKKELSSL